MKKSNQFRIISTCEATQVAEEAIFPLEEDEYIEGDYEEEENDEFDKEASYKGNGNYALFIGINKYANEHKLTGCVNDANDIKDKFTLEMGWNKENTKTLLDTGH